MRELANLSQTMPACSVRAAKALQHESCIVVYFAVTEGCRHERVRPLVIKGPEHDGAVARVDSLHSLRRLFWTLSLRAKATTVQ